MVHIWSSLSKIRRSLFAMTKTKYWLSIVAIAAVLIAGSLAVSPIAIASDEPDDDDDDDDKNKKGNRNKQVYETSATAEMLQGESISSIAQLRCRDGDWMNGNTGTLYADVTSEPSFEGQGLTIAIKKFDSVGERNFNTVESAFKVIGKDVTFDIVNPIGAVAPFDSTFTVTTLCFNPSN